MPVVIDHINDVIFSIFMFFFIIVVMRLMMLWMIERIAIIIVMFFFPFSLSVDWCLCLLKVVLLFDFLLSLYFFLVFSSFRSLAL